MAKTKEYEKNLETSKGLWHYWFLWAFAILSLVSGLL